MCNMLCVYIHCPLFPSSNKLGLCLFFRFLWRFIQYFTLFFILIVQKRGRTIRIKIFLANAIWFFRNFFYSLETLIMSAPMRMTRLQVTNCISLLVNLEPYYSFELFLILTLFYPWNGKESVVIESNFRNGYFDVFTHDVDSWIQKSRV